jgi:hypothetical protein
LSVTTVEVIKSNGLRTPMINVVNAVTHAADRDVGDVGGSEAVKWGPEVGKS